MKNKHQHNYKKMQVQDRIISSLLIVIALASYASYKQARVIEAKGVELQTVTAEKFAKEMLAYDYSQELIAKQKWDETVQTAKYGTVPEKIAVLALSPNEAELIRRESSFNHLAKNPTSTAFGLWQGLTSTRKAMAKLVGCNPNTDSPFEQRDMFRTYIKVTPKYKTVEKALSFHDQKGWY